MKRIFSLVSATLIASTALAAPVVINDSFTGGAPNNPGYYGLDIIGEADLFSISGMDVDVAGGNLVVNVYSAYFNNVGQSGTTLGDLFISTNGWNPFGPSAFADDTAANGETWERVLVLDNHGSSAGPVSMLGSSGAASLYAVQDASQIGLTSAGGRVDLQSESRSSVPAGHGPSTGHRFVVNIRSARFY